MSSFDALVGSHYGSTSLLDRILEGLDLAGKDPASLVVDDLIPVDAFHTRGRAATVELAGLGALSAGDHVLDVGCGLGGTARHLAETYGCRVDGIDLTGDYITAGNRLTELVGLDGLIDLRQGSALEIPHEGEKFDIAWTEHVQMNIEDKRTFFREMARVLKPGGRLLFHDVFRGEGEPPVYPVPWAEDASISFLAGEQEARASIEQAGLSIEAWKVKTAESVAFFDKVTARIATEGMRPVGLHLLMGPNAPEKLRNFLLNMNEDRVTIVMGMAVKTG